MIIALLVARVQGKPCGVVESCSDCGKCANRRLVRKKTGPVVTKTIFCLLKEKRLFKK
jgi:uncharacterized cysteine cluster protein YcgN (CxxCxxCC family)